MKNYNKGAVIDYMYTYFPFHNSRFLNLKSIIYSSNKQYNNKNQLETKLEVISYFQIMCQNVYQGSFGFTLAPGSVIEMEQKNSVMKRNQSHIHSLPIALPNW